MKQSDRVRDIVRTRHVDVARRAGLHTVSVSARDVLKEAEASDDFPRARTPLICNVLQSKKLLEENGLEIEKIEGPPSRQSRRVVVHYRLLPHSPGRHERSGSSAVQVPEETPEDWVARVTAPLLGLMKDKITEHGGTEGYLRWVRGYDQEQE